MNAPPVTPPATHVEAELVRMLYQHTWLMSLVVGVAASGATAYLFADLVPAGWASAWFVAINVIIGVRIAFTLAYQRRRPTPADHPLWRRRYVTAVWLNGLAWGLPALVLTGDSLTLTFFYATVLCGFVAGAVPNLSYNVHAFVGFAVLSGAPLALRLATFDETFFRVIAALTVLFVMINVASVRISNRRVREQIRLEFANRELVRHLTLEKERAERADAVKSQFLAAASHDLRQPLHALSLFVEALDAHADRPALRALIDNIKLSTSSLSDLLNALLDISRLDAGAVQPERSTFPLQPLFAKLKSEFQADADEKGLELRLASTDAWVHTDLTMLTRILQNVIVNALRYTQRGRVLIGCRRHGDDVRIEVHDTGVGMTGEHLSHVFEEFYQVGNAQRDRRLGLGLGLAIVRRLAAMLGHDIALDSRPGGGTVFRLRLPRVQPQPTPALLTSPVAADLTGLCVVVIDDEAHVREAMRQMLELWSCEVVAAVSGPAALEALAKRAGAPHLIIADYRLCDGETGVQAIGDIRARYRQDIPAIIVTGDTAPDRLREAQASGYQLLHKPVSAARMRSLASHLLRPVSVPPVPN